VVKDTIGLLKSELVLKGVAARLDLAGRLPLVLGNATELQQVVLNLVLNAIDVLASNAPLGRQIVISAVENGEFVRCSVADSGPGIGQEQLDRIFEPFFSTKAKGMGMGLAICHAIIDAHGGRLWAENAPTGGAIFHFTLPRNK